MIDIVIPYKQSQWADNELRFALRSVEKHLKNYRKIYVIGHRPAWMNLGTVVHIPFEDKYSHERNILEKILHVCKYAQLSDDFLLMNDDHYLASIYNATRFPYYFYRSLEQKLSSSRGAYADSVRNTLFALKARRLPHAFYDVHTPILYNKSLFPEVMEMYNWEGKRNGFIIKSLYCNTLRLKGMILPDCKINKPMSCFEIEKWLEDRHMFSTPDKITPEVATFLNYLFPDKSKYEI